MMNQKSMACTAAQKQHPLKVSLASCLLLTAIGTTSLLVGCGSENTAQSVDAGSTPAQPDQNRQGTSTTLEQNPLPDQANQNDGTRDESSVPVAQTEQILHGATTNNSSFIQLNALRSEVKELSDSVAELKKQEETRRQEEAKTAPLWQILLFALLIVLGLVLPVLLIKAKWVQLQNQLKQLEGQIKLNIQPAVNQIKTQIGDLDREIRQLQRKIKELEQKQQQQPNPEPVVVKASDPSADILMPQSELSISKPLLTIDADDRQALQEAFLEWRANSRGKKIYDFLPSGFLEKIKQLGYDIVFAKAGVGLERMIIDRKPPSSTRMVGLSSTAHSIMYCYNKTYEGDECWTPDTWYEVSIDSPDAANEQTVHKGKELLT